MLEISADVVCAIIAQAREFHAQEGVVIPESGDAEDEDWARQILAAHADDPTYEQLRVTIDELSVEEQVQLVALMWVGRGDFSAEEWDEAVAEAARGHTAHTAEYLLATPLLASYLEEGLAAFGISCEE